MDKREAMLRELNLYPMWVRRNPAHATEQQTAAVEQATAREPAIELGVSVDAVGESVGTVVEHVAAPVVAPFGTPVVAPVVAPVGTMEAIVEQAASTEDIFAAVPDEYPANDPDAQASLREFQMQNQGGALGRVDWPELKQLVRDCELCALRAGCTRTVAGTGNEQADWLFVGEAPGAEEDATGEPFVEHAGRLLDNMLLAIKLKRREVYIANVIKCRPPDDRHPHVGEIAACLPYLKRQIDLVQPKVIVALGKTAASSLLETDATIASLRGKVHDYKGIPLIVTFHPAYLLRSPHEKAKAWQDLCLAAATMQAPESDKRN